MSGLKTRLPTDEWITATWDEYLTAIAEPGLDKAQCYYDRGQLRIEMTPQGFDLAQDNFSIGYAVALFCALRGIPIAVVANCSFRKTGDREAQPDLAFYIGDNAEAIPADTSVVDLDIYPPPDLAIEIAKTSLADDIGSKRMLYERLGVAEYWVVNVRQAKLVAFAIADGGSRAIAQSQLLPDLPFTLLEEALGRSRATGRSQLYGWLIAQIQAIGN